MISEIIARILDLLIPKLLLNFVNLKSVCDSDIWGIFTSTESMTDINTSKWTKTVCSSEMSIKVISANQCMCYSLPQTLLTVTIYLL